MHTQPVWTQRYGVAAHLCGMAAYPSGNMVRMVDCVQVSVVAVCACGNWLYGVAAYLCVVDMAAATYPSHIDIPGNERADVLAEEGRVSSPLYQVLSLPDRAVVSLELPSTPTPRQAPAVPRSLELQDVITPSRETPA